MKGKLRRIPDWWRSGIIIWGGEISRSAEYRESDDPVYKWRKDGKMIMTRVMDVSNHDGHYQWVDDGDVMFKPVFSV